MRRLEIRKAGKVNPLWNMYRTISRCKVFKDFIFIEHGRYAPSTRGKHVLYMNELCMKHGDNVSLACHDMPALMYTERIHIRKNSIIGYNTVILTHEYLVDEYRIGDVRIGHDTMVGANVTILPGVVIGNHAVVGAGSVVSKDVPDHSTCYGNPLVIRSRNDE